MTDTNNFIIDKITKLEAWQDVPQYQKINIKYLLKLLSWCLLGSFEAQDMLSFYLNNRKRNNKKYKDFWKDTSNITFNDDKSKYLCYVIDNVTDVNIS